MGVEILKSQRWRYDFIHLGRRFRKGGYATRRLAENAERQRRQEVQEAEQGLRPFGIVGEVSLFGVVRRFVSDRDSHWRPETQGYYRDQFQLIAMAFPDDLPLTNRNEVEEALRTFLNMRKNDASAATANKYAQTLRTLFRHSRENGLLSWEPRLPKFKAAKRMIRVLSDQEMEAILKLATPRIRSFILVMANTGLRANEARQLRWRDINLEQAVLTVVNSKTHRSRLIPLNASALSALRETALADGPLALTPDSFVFNSGGRQLAGIHEWEIAKLFKKMGIRPGNRLHAFRHCFASKLIARGADAATVKELLGHASIQMTMDLYVHLFPDQKRKAVALLDD